VTYEEAARINLEPTVVTELNRAGIHGKIPGRVGPKTAAPCLACGLQLARQLAGTGPPDREAVIILAMTGEAPDIGGSQNTSSSQLPVPSNASVPVHVLTYSSSTRLPLDFADQVLVIDEKEDSVDDIGNLFTSLLHRNSVPGPATKLQFYHTRVRLGAGERSGGKFVVEDALRRDLYIVASTQHKEDVENFELTSPSGRQYKFPVVEKGVLYFLSAGLSESGVWSFSLRIAASAMLTTTSGTTCAVVVSAYAAPTVAPGVMAAGRLSQGSDSAAAGDTAILDAWTAGEYPNLRLYARLFYGRMAVHNASVRAIIGGNKDGDDRSLEVILEDKGSGYPDVMAGDGIYSAYVTGLSARPAGFYTLAFRADDAKGQARVVAAASSAQSQPSRSSPAAALVPTPAFSRFARASLQLTQAVRSFIRDGRPQAEDLQPPARVTDLQVESYITGSLQVSLAWTAPGGDFNMGKAARYELRCYTNREALDEDRFAATGLPVPSNLLPEPALAGQRQTATIGLPWHSEVFYYGLVAYDAAENRGLVSNLVPVFVDELAAADSTSNSSSLQATGLLKPAVMFQSGEDDNIVYIVAGSLTGLALIAICLGIAFVCRARRKEMTDSSESLDYVKEFGLPGGSLLPATSKVYTLPPTYSPALPQSSPSDYSQDSVFLSQKELEAAASSLYTTYQNLQPYSGGGSRSGSSEQSPPPASDSSEDALSSCADSRREILLDHQAPLHAQRLHSLDVEALSPVDGGGSWRGTAFAHSWSPTRLPGGEIEGEAVSPGHHLYRNNINNSNNNNNTWSNNDSRRNVDSCRSDRQRGSVSNAGSMRGDSHSVDLDQVDFRDKRRRRESFV